MKKCPFCAEEIQDEAIKCKYCGESLKGDSQIDKHFDSYEEWLKMKWPLYKVASKNEEEKYLIIQKEFKSFNVVLFSILLLLWVLPAIIYILLPRQKIISLVVHFDNQGKASIEDNSFQFLANNYNVDKGLGKTKQQFIPDKLII